YLMFGSVTGRESSYEKAFSKPTRRPTDVPRDFVATTKSNPSCSVAFPITIGIASARSTRTREIGRDRTPLIPNACAKSHRLSARPTAGRVLTDPTTDHNVVRVRLKPDTPIQAASTRQTVVLAWLWRES